MLTTHLSAPISLIRFHYIWQKSVTMRFGIIGSGSWATALAKILTDNEYEIYWHLRSEDMVTFMRQRHHNPNYLSSVHFNSQLLHLTTDLNEVINNADMLIIAVPSAYLVSTLQDVQKDAFRNLQVISAVKGILPESNQLVNEFLHTEFSVKLDNYFTVMGPCHAEEVASEKLSYLTISGSDTEIAGKIAAAFSTPYLNTIVNNDVIGVQYAAILKNIYALGAGIAHGLEYGDNFQSVLIANCADEMAGFLQKVGIRNIEVGKHEGEDLVTHRKTANYAASVYLGDLLVTCYSLFSRNRTFGNMIGKGYSVKAAQLEMNMVAEGFNASKCIHSINQRVKADMPIAETIYQVLWENVKPSTGFNRMEDVLV
jgi:glycerol-3-phosphate dehydrogenase (NAD(P)+)